MQRQHPRTGEAVAGSSKGNFDSHWPSNSGSNKLVTVQKLWFQHRRGVGPARRQSDFAYPGQVRVINEDNHHQSSASKRCGGARVALFEVRVLRPRCSVVPVSAADPLPPSVFEPAASAARLRIPHFKITIESPGIDVLRLALPSASQTPNHVGPKKTLRTATRVPAAHRARPSPRCWPRCMRCVLTFLFPRV